MDIFLLSQVTLELKIYSFLDQKWTWNKYFGNIQPTPINSNPNKQFIIKNAKCLWPTVANSAGQPELSEAIQAIQKAKLEKLVNHNSMMSCCHVTM